MCPHLPPDSSGVVKLSLLYQGAFTVLFSPFLTGNYFHPKQFSFYFLRFKNLLKKKGGIQEFAP